jgi:DNA-binding XRE family transcriptional regulator
MDHETLGRHAGLSRRAIENLESGLFSNPSITTVRLLARVLRTSTSQLLDGVPHRLEDHDPVVRRSFDSLQRFGGDNKVPLGDVQGLWDAFLPEYKKQREAVADARTAAVTVAEWGQRYAATKGTGKKNGGRQSGLFAEDE